MQVEKTDIEGLLVITPRRFNDHRGSFFEAYNHLRFIEETGLDINWLQDNESRSIKDVIRGLHLQIPPYDQEKLVRVSQGSVYDVAVDLRKSSPSFGKSFGILLSAENARQLYIPKGFAHGFKVLEDDTIFSYKCSNVFSADHERSILWNDADLAIDWNSEHAILSEKDAIAPTFAKFENPFE